MLLEGRFYHPPIFLPVHIRFYPSKWWVDRSLHKAMLSPLLLRTLKYIFLPVTVGGERIMRGRRVTKRQSGELEKTVNSRSWLDVGENLQVMLLWSFQWLAYISLSPPTHFGFVQFNLDEPNGIRQNVGGWIDWKALHLCALLWSVVGESGTSGVS